MRVRETRKSRCVSKGEDGGRWLVCPRSVVRMRRGRKFGRRSSQNCSFNTSDPIIVLLATSPNSNLSLKSQS